MQLVEVAFEEAASDGLFDAERFRLLEESPSDHNHDDGADEAGKDAAFDEAQEQDGDREDEEADTGDHVSDGVHVVTFRCVVVLKITV